MPRTSTQKPPADMVLQALADEIIALEIQYGTRCKAKAGRRIIDRLFMGDIALFRSKDPKKTESMKTLARLLGRSPTRVWALVAVSIVYDALPVDLRDRLTASHLEELHHAPDIEWERLAREAVALRLNSTELRARVQGRILPDPMDPAASDRRPLARAVRALDELERQIARATPEERPELLRQLDEIADHIARLRERLAEDQPPG